MKLNRLFLLLFSLPFTLIGVGVLLFAVVPTIHDWSRMQGWVAVEATLNTADINSHRSSKSIVYQATASYSYHYGGGQYQGNRVGISGGSDNIGDWQERVYHEMTQMRPLRVWVNPDNPAESIFDRSLRWGQLGFLILFVLLFGGIGVGLTFVALRAQDTPEGVPLWQADPDWRENQIRSNARAGMWGAWIFAIFWLLLSSPIVFIVPGELAKDNTIAIIGLIFPLVGVMLAISAVRKTRQWRRFGPTPLSLDPFPGAIGGDVGGTITISQPMPAEAVAEIVLRCEHVYRQGSGKNATTKRDLLWEGQQQARCAPGMDGVRIGFCFKVPEGLPGSSKQYTERHEWTLNVTCELPGVDLDRHYTIPVFPGFRGERSSVRP